MKFGRRFQQTEQLVELPIDHQIYDIIDAKRTEGATVIEVDNCTFHCIVNNLLVVSSKIHFFIKKYLYWMILLVFVTTQNDFIVLFSTFSLALALKCLTLFACIRLRCVFPCRDNIIFVILCGTCF